LKQYEYEAILGCKELRDLTRVLNKTVYVECLARFKVNTFEDIINTINASAFNYIENLSNSIPKSDLEILLSYKQLLESRSIVNFLKSEIRPDNIVAMTGVIPFGSFPLGYYDNVVSSKEKYKSPELAHIIEHSISLVKKHNSLSPLLKIILFFCEVVSSKIAKSSSAKWRSLSKLVNYIREATVIELNILNIRSGIALEITEKWGSLKSVLKNDQFNMFPPKKNEAQIISLLKKTRYGFCLENRSNKNVDDVLKRFPYCVMSKEAHSILAGYPFLPSTVAAGMMLILVEVRNIKLAIAAVDGKLDKLEALRLMTIS
ncbi:hypothetical protein, partial [[Eubacterium] cellulosolvens]